MIAFEKNKNNFRSESFAWLVIICKYRFYKGKLFLLKRNSNTQTIFAGSINMDETNEKKEKEEISFLFGAIFGSLVVMLALQYVILSNLSKVNVDQKI